MKKVTIVLTLLYFLLNLEEVLAQQGSKVTNLSDKQVFDVGFPKTLSFRGDRLLLKNNYSDWEARHVVYNGVTKKYLNEEIQMPPIAAEWANTFSDIHSEKLMLVHLNGEGKSVNDPAIFARYFPGHWVYEAGSTPKNDISNKTNKIAVDNATHFSMKAYTVHGKDIGVDKVPHDVLLVKLDEQGNRIWDQYEYAKITRVDYAQNIIEVKRGQYGTKRKSFSKDRTYIAPVAGDIWGGNLMWYYNLSSSCPLDKKGQSAADVFVGEITDWFGIGGPLEKLDGIGFDVNYFEVKHSTWDCNNDGIIDNGIVDGKNIWRVGDITFLQKIRAAFGPEFIITADGWNDNMQRGVGILNGMESEGLCRWNDGFRQISRTINQHTYWNMHNTTKYKFSYITSKLRNPADLKIEDQLRRLGLGLASCLDVTYSPSPDLVIPEMYGGDLNQSNWLGQPLTPKRYFLDDQQDLFAGMGMTFSSDLLGQFELVNTAYSVDNNQLMIEGLHTDRRRNMHVKGPELKINSGDLLIFFEAKAIEGFQDLENGGLIPRKINIKLEGMPDFPKEPMNTHRLYNELAGFIGTAGYTPQMFYFRNVGGADLRMIFEVEEQGKIAIRNLRAYNTTCLITRDFENGVVLVNPSNNNVIVNLEHVFERNYQYKYLKTERMDGQIINNNTHVELPSLDALFLLKK